MREAGLDIVEAAFERRSLCLRLLGDHALHALDLFGISDPQIVKALLLGHVDTSVQVQFAASRQQLSSPVECVRDVLPRLARGLRRERMEDLLGVGDLGQCAL